MPRWLGRANITVFVLFAVTCLWCASNLRNANVVSRLGLTHSMIAHGTLDIDEVAPLTIDKARTGDHYRCDKAPGISLLCLPGVFIAERVADAAGEPHQFLDIAQPDRIPLRYVLAAYACLLTTTILLSALALVSFRRTLLATGASPWVADGAAIALGFGTPFFIWSTTAFGHATSAALLWLAFAQRWRGARPGTPLSPGLALLTGLLLAVAVLVEFTAAPPAAMIGLLLLADGGKQGAAATARRAGWLALGAIPAALVLMAYNAAAFGSPFRLGYGSVQGFNGMKSGFFGVSMPSLRALWGITFSAYRGILWLAPVLVFAVPALVSLLRTREARSGALVCLAVALYYLSLNSAYFYWDGGRSLGPRHITPMVPFLMFAIAIWLDRAPAWRTPVGVIGIVGVIVTLVATSVRMNVPDDGKPMLMAHVLPALRAGESDLALAKAGLPFALLVGMPLVLALLTAGLLWLWRGGRDRDDELGAVRAA